MNTVKSQGNLSSLLAQFLTQRTRLIIGFMAVCTLISGVGMLQLKINPSTEKAFPDDHEAVRNFARFRECFTNDEFIVLAYETNGSVYEYKNIAQNRDITNKIQKIGFHLDGFKAEFRPFTSIASLSNLSGLAPEGFGKLVSKPVFPDKLEQVASKSATEIKSLVHRAVGAKSKAVRLFVGNDEKSTAIVLELARPAELNSRQLGEFGRQTVQRLRDLIHAEFGKSKLQAHLAGAPVVKADIVSALRAELATFTLPLVGIAAFVAFLVFRSMRGVILPLIVIGLTSAFLFGFMGFAGFELQPMTTLLSPLMFVVGIADSIHVLVELESQTKDGKTDFYSVLDHVLKPCFVTSLTTSIGFASLTFGPIGAVREFGLLAAMGTTLAFVLTFVVLIPLWKMLPPYFPARRDGLELQNSAKWILKLATPVSIISILFCGYCAMQLQNISFDTDFVGFFKPDSELRQAVSFIQPRFGGIASLEVMIEGEPDVVFSQKTLQTNQKFQNWLESKFEPIDLTFSMTDVVEAGTQKLFGNKVIPSDQLLSQLKIGLSQDKANNQQVRRLITPDFKVMRISVRTRTMGSDSLSNLLAKIRKEAAQLYESDKSLKVTVTGTPVIFSDSSYTMLFGQLESFLWALVTITIVLIITLRSVKLGLLSIIPNVFPICVTFGMLSALKIPLNSFNSMVASVAIGIAVDDTIHVLVSFQNGRGRYATREALERTISHTGAAVLATSFMLACGFGILCIGQFLPTAHFGLLTCISILAAIIGDLFLLPWILLSVEKYLGLSVWNPANCISGDSQIDPESSTSETAPDKTPATAGDSTEAP